MPETSCACASYACSKDLPLQHLLRRRATLLIAAYDCYIIMTTRHQQEQQRINDLENLIVKIQNRRKEEVSCRKRMNDTIGSTSFREEEAGELHLV